MSASDKVDVGPPGVETGAARRKRVLAGMLAAAHAQEASARAQAESARAQAASARAQEETARRLRELAALLADESGSGGLESGPLNDEGLGWDETTMEIERDTDGTDGFNDGRSSFTRRSTDEGRNVASFVRQRLRKPRRSKQPPS